MKSRVRVLWLAGIGVLLVVSVMGGVTMSQVEAVSKGEAIGFGVGYRPPDFDAKDLGGHRQTLQQYQGRVVVLHFWASWCPYCRKEITKLTTLAQPQWAQKGVSVVTIAVDEDVPKLKQFISQSALTYPVIIDRELASSVSDQYGVSGLPTTYVLRRDGHIAARLNGVADLLAAVQTALAK